MGTLCREMFSKWKVSRMNKQTTLLSTALLEQPVIDRAAAEGVVLDVASFIEIRFRSDVDTIVEVEELCGLPVTAVFTSANAVKAIAEIVKNRQPDWDIYCLGT